jgi:hypothetical protein
MQPNERFLFDLQGYLTVPNALTPAQLAGLNDIVDEKLAQDTTPEMNTMSWGDGGDRPGRPWAEFGSEFGYRQLLTWGEPLMALVDNPRLSPYLQELLGGSPSEKTIANGGAELPRFRLDHIYCNVLRAGGRLGGLHGGRSLRGGLGTHFYDYTAGGSFMNGLLVVAYELADVNPGDGGFGCVPVRLRA